MRKKQPALVRRKLLDRAAKLAVKSGLNSVTIQSVAKAAGVTTGGLLHHFSSKQALIQAVFENLLEQLDADIDALMAQDQRPIGSFTRAYVRTSFPDLSEAESKLRAAIYAYAMGDSAMRWMWADWLQARLQRHADTDSGPMLEVVRYAADGAWMADSMHRDGLPEIDRKSILERLLNLTYDRP